MVTAVTFAHSSPGVLARTSNHAISGEKCPDSTRVPETHALSMVVPGRQELDTGLFKGIHDIIKCTGIRGARTPLKIRECLFCHSCHGGQLELVNPKQGARGPALMSGYFNNVVFLY